jgi:hypothetical protein
MSLAATLTLGRDGMGPEADEADFDAWTTYVCEHIDEATGLDVAVEIRGERDVQDDHIVADDDDRESIENALVTLWEAFCADTTLWPSREPAAPVDSDETRDCLGLAVHGRTPDNEQ